MTTTAQAVDQAKVEEFVGKVLGDAAGTMTVVLAAIGIHPEGNAERLLVSRP